MKFRKSPASKPVPVWLDPELQDRITQLSTALGEPKSTVMRITMRLGLDQMEDALSKRAARVSSARIEAAGAEIWGAALASAAGSPAKAAPPAAAAWRAKGSRRRQKRAPGKTSPLLQPPSQ